VSQPCNRWSQPNIVDPGYSIFNWNRICSEQCPTRHSAFPPERWWSE
jgi:hypothetical protein